MWQFVILTVLCYAPESFPGTLEPAGHGAERAAHFLRGALLQASLFGTVSVHLRRHCLPGAVAQRQGVYAATQLMTPFYFSTMF